MNDLPHDPQRASSIPNLIPPSLQHDVSHISHEEQQQQQPPQPVALASNLAASAPPENHDTKAPPTADGKKHMRRILRRPQPLNLDHSKLLRHSSAAGVDQTAPPPAATTATDIGVGHGAPSQAAAHITVEIPPPLPSSTGGPNSAGSSQHHAFPITTHASAAAGLSRSLPRASSIDQTTKARATSAWQTGIQRQLIKIQRRKQAPSLFSWYSRQATRALILPQKENADILGHVKSDEQFFENAATYRLQVQEPWLQTSSSDYNTSPFVPAIGSSVPPTQATEPMSTIPAWVTQSSNASAPEFYSDEAVDLLLHLRDYLIEATQKGWDAFELREPVLPPNGSRSLFGARRSKSIVPNTKESPNPVSPANNIPTANTGNNRQYEMATTSDATAPPQVSPHPSVHGYFDYGGSTTPAQQQHQTSDEKPLADDQQPQQQQQQQQYKLLDVLLFVLADVIRHDCRYPVQHVRPSRPEWALHSIVLDILFFLCRHFLKDHRAMYDIGLVALEAFAMFKNNALVRLMDLVVETILPSFAISRLDLGNFHNTAPTMVAAPAVITSPSAPVNPPFRPGSPPSSSPPSVMISPNAATQMHPSNTNNSTTANSKGSGFLAVPTMDRSGSPRLSFYQPSTTPSPTYDDRDVNVTERQQQQLQRAAVLDQHAASLIWSTLFAMLDQISVHRSPLPVVHKFFMSLSNLIKIKPNLDQDLLEIMSTVDSFKIMKRAMGVLSWMCRSSVGHLILARPLTPIDFDTVLLLRRDKEGSGNVHAGGYDPSTGFSFDRDRRRNMDRKTPGGSGGGHTASKRQQWRRKSLSSIFSNDRGVLGGVMSSTDSAASAGTTQAEKVYDFLAGHEVYPVMFTYSNSDGSGRRHSKSNSTPFATKTWQEYDHPLPKSRILNHHCERCDQPIQGFGAYCYVCDSSLHWGCYYRIRQMTTMGSGQGDSGCAVPAVGTLFIELPPSARWQLYTPDLDGCRLRGEHQLVLVNLFSTLLCYVCRRPLWGHQHQAYRCQGCCQFMHVRCKAEANRYADECLLQHHGGIPTATTMERVATSFREHYQELIQTWNETHQSRDRMPSSPPLSSSAATSPVVYSFEEASTIYSALAVQAKLLQSALDRGELKISGINNMDDFKDPEKNKGLELFAMLQFFEERVEVMWKNREWSIDLADYFEDDDGRVAEGMPAFLLFHSRYWRHFGFMVKTLLLEPSQNDHLNTQHHQAPFSFSETLGSSGGGGLGSSSASAAAAMEDLTQYGFEVDAIELMHQQLEGHGQFKLGPEVATTHCHSLVSIFRLCSQRLGIVSRWSLRQILQAWINMGILERQDGSSILFEEGTAKVTVSADTKGGGNPTVGVEDSAAEGRVGGFSTMAATSSNATSLLSATIPPPPPLAGAHIYRSMPCYFPVVSAIDPSANVEVLIQSIWRCLESVNLSLNECGFQLLVRRCAPDPFMSDYTTERLVGAIFYWLFLEDDHLVHIMTELMPRAAAAAVAGGGHSNSMRSFPLMLPGVLPSIVELTKMKHQALEAVTSTTSSATAPSSNLHALTKQMSSSATDSETASTFSSRSDQRQQYRRGTGGIFNRLRATPALHLDADEQQHQHQHQHQKKYQHNSLPTGQGLNVNSNIHPYLLTRQLLKEKYALPWLQSIKDLDPKRYLDMTHRQILVLERELVTVHSHAETHASETSRHDQLERHFECITRLKQAGFLFELFPTVLQHWQNEVVDFLSSAESNGDGTNHQPARFQSLHNLFFEAQDLFAGGTESSLPRMAGWMASNRVKSESSAISGGSGLGNQQLHRRWATSASDSPFKKTTTSTKQNVIKSNKHEIAPSSALDAGVMNDGNIIMGKVAVAGALSDTATDGDAKGAEIKVEDPNTALYQILLQAEKGGSDGISKMLTWIELLLAARVPVPTMAFTSCSEIIVNTAHSDNGYNPVNHSKRLLQLCWEQIAYTSQCLSDSDAYKIVTTILMANVTKIRISKQKSYSYSADDLAEVEGLRALVKHALAICMCVYGCPVQHVVSLELTPTEASRPRRHDPFDSAVTFDQEATSPPLHRHVPMSFSLPKHRLDKQDNIIGIFLDSLKSPVLEVEGEVIAAFATIFDLSTRVENLKNLMDNISDVLVIKIWDMLLPQNDHLVDMTLPLLMRCIVSKPMFFQQMVEKHFNEEDWEIRFVQLDHAFGLFSTFDDAFAMRILFQHSLPLEQNPQSPDQRSEPYYEDHEPLRILGFLGPLVSCMVSCIWDKRDAVRTKAKSLLRALQPVNVYYTLKAWEIHFISSSMDVQQNLCRLMTGLNNHFPGWRIMDYGLIFDLLTVKKSTHHWRMSDDDGGVFSNAGSRRASLSLNAKEKKGKRRSRSSSVASVASVASGMFISKEKDAGEKSSRLSKLRRKNCKKKKIVIPIEVEGRRASHQKHTTASSACSSLKSVASSTSSVTSDDTSSSQASEDSGDELQLQLDDLFLQQAERQDELAREDDLYCSLLNLALQMVANGIEPTLHEVIQLKYLVVFYLDFEDCELLNVGDGNQQVHFGQYSPHHGSVYDPGHETFVLAICMNLKLILDRYVEIRPDEEQVPFGDHPLSSYRSTSTLGLNNSGLSTSGGGVDDGSVTDPILCRKSQEQMFRDYCLQQRHLQHHSQPANGSTINDTQPATETNHHSCDTFHDPVITSTQRSQHRRHYQHSSQYATVGVQHQQQQQRHTFHQYQKFYSRRDDRQDENAPVVGTYFVDVILRFFGAEPDLAAVPTERLKNWLELFLIVIYKYVSEQDQLQDFIIALMRKVVDMLLMKRPSGGLGGLGGGGVVRLDDDYVAKENILLGISICHTLLRRSIKMTALILSREIMAMGRLMTRRRNDPEDPVLIKARAFLHDAFELFLGNGLFLLVFKNQPVLKDAWTNSRIEDDPEEDGDSNAGQQQQEADLFYVLTEVLGENEMVSQDPSSPHSPLVLLRDQPIRDVIDRVMIFKDLQPLQVSRILTNLWLYVERVHSSFHDPKIMTDFGAFFIKLSKYMNEWGTNIGSSSHGPHLMAMTGGGTASGTGASTTVPGSHKPVIASQVKKVDANHIQQLQEQHQQRQRPQRLQLEEKQRMLPGAATAGAAKNLTLEGTGEDTAGTKSDGQGLSADGALTVPSNTSSPQTAGTANQETVSTNATTVMTPQAYLKAIQSSKPSGEEGAGKESTEDGDGILERPISQAPEGTSLVLAQTQLNGQDANWNGHEASSTTATVAAANAPVLAGPSTSEAQSYAASQKDRLLAGSETVAITDSNKSAAAESMHTEDSDDGNYKRREGGGLFGLLMNPLESVRGLFGGGRASKDAESYDEEKTLEGHPPHQRQPGYPVAAQPPPRFGTVMSSIRHPTMMVGANDVHVAKLHATTWDIANPVLRMCAVLMVRVPLEAFVLVPGSKVLLRQALYRDSLSPEALLGICAAYAFMAEMDMSLELINVFGEVVVEELKAAIKGTRTIRPTAANLILIHHLLEWQANPSLHPRWTSIKDEYLGKMRFPPGLPVLFPGVSETLLKETALLFAD